MADHLVIFGLGYSGHAVAAASVRAGVATTATSRDPSGVRAPAGVAVVPFDAVELSAATHILVTAPPGPDGDPVLARHAAAIESAPALRWIGYISTTGVYGNRGGGWVDEATPPAPGSPRSARRLAAERQWEKLADRRAVDIFRAAGIYGPGRSALDDVRAGRARRLIRPGHAFGRIHRDDIAHAVMAAIGQDLPAGIRILHLSDDEPAPTADVVAEAARLLGAPMPPAIPFEQAEPAMSEMARSFWAENRRVSSAATRAALGISWLYPSYREGLASILAEQGPDNAPQQSEVGRS